MRKRVIYAIGLLVGLVLITSIAVSAAPSPQAATPKRGGTLTILLAEEVKGLYNQQDTGTEGEYPANQITDGLVNADPDRNIIPGLATSWEISPDGLTYTFKLRQGVKFHDGKAFDANDVKYTMDEGSKEGTYSGAKYFPYIAKTEVVDPYTVKITLKQPFPDFMPTLAYEEDLDILDKDAVTKWGSDYGYKAAVGTGPFKFDHWTRGQELVLVRNDDYWDKDKGYPYLDKIIYRAVTEDAVKMMQLTTKNADAIFSVPFTNVNALKIDKNIVVDSVPGGTVHFLGFATENAPFKDVKVRQGLCYGIDRKAIADTIFAGQAAIANSIFPPMLPYSTNDKVVYDYNPDKAKALLAEAGYNANKPLKFLMLTSNAAPYPDEAVLIQAQLKKIGVQADIQPLEKAALSTYTSGTAPDAKDKRQAFLYRYGYSGSFVNDYTYRSFNSKGGLNNFAFNKPGGFQDPELDKLIADTAIMSDKDKMMTNNRLINDAILKDAPWCYIAYQNNIIAYQSYVKGVKNWPLSTFPMRVVWLDK